MKLSIECLPCLLKQAVNLARIHMDSEEDQRRLLKEIMRVMAAADEEASAPSVACQIQRLLKEAIQNPDPYREEKQHYNREMLKLEAEFEKLIHSSENPLAVGLKLAAAGNIIDFGPGHDLSLESVLEVVNQTLARDFPAELFESLKTRLQESRSLLYLGDNAGEIVFDKVFIRTIKEHYPGLDVDFATRGEAVLNDITEEDAYYVGMDACARIINNGTGIPGTVLERCSPVFQRAFQQADIIVAKGQGNFETLYGSGRENLFFLFLCKCNLFVERLGARKNDIMLIQDRGSFGG